MYFPCLKFEYCICYTIENDKENFKTKTLNKVSEWQNDLPTIDLMHLSIFF